MWLEFVDLSSDINLEATVATMFYSILQAHVQSIYRINLAD